MIVRNIKINKDKWIDLQTEVSVKTNEGVKKIKKVYLNGFTPTKKVYMSDGNHFVFTYNHKLMTNNGWVRTDELAVGDLFNNGLRVDKIEEGKVELTMDMEVPDVHYYILHNGVMSHNTSYVMGGETLNLSEGVEPHKSNYTSKKLAKIQSEVKNYELVQLLQELGQDTKEVWDSILKNNGSVQHLDFLSDHQKAVFKTFSEISQVDVIKLAAQRQKYIDQGQSINVMIHPDTPARDINQLYLMAFEEGLKGLYYQYSINAAQEFSKDYLTCSSCEA